MSYGKWKALQPIMATERNTIVDEFCKRCLICGKPIPAEFHKHSKYCIGECRHEASKAIHRANYHRKKERMMANGKI